MFQDLDYEIVRQHIIKSSKETSIYVACDSKVKKTSAKKGHKLFAIYSTVVIIHLDSCRGCVIYGRNDTLSFYGSLKQRLMQEVYFATEAALEVVDAVGDRHFEIHLDINPDARYKSNIAVKEACGYVRGMLGLDPKLKPESLMASNAADHYG